jgi:hypothetical protein
LRSVIGTRPATIAQSIEPRRRHRRTLYGDTDIAVFVGYTAGVQALRSGSEGAA